MRVWRESKIQLTNAKQLGNLVAVGLTTGEVTSIFSFDTKSLPSILKVHIYRDEQLADVLR